MPLLNYNPGHNILELYNVLVQVRFATSKMKINIWYNKFGLRVASGLQNNFSRILGNKEILEKSQNWMKTETSAQSPSQKLIFGNSSQIIPKSRYQSFVVLSNLFGFLYLVPNISLHKKMKFSIKDFFSKCDQIRSLLRI